MRKDSSKTLVDLPHHGFLKLANCQMNSLACKCFFIVLIIVVYRTMITSHFPGFHWVQESGYYQVATSDVPGLQRSVRRKKFLEVPQIVWGLNNQKIAFARACLTARLLNRTLLMPRLSASLFYKEIELLQPITFDKVFKFERFNSLCHGFVQLGQYTDLVNQTKPYELQKGSGRRWTKERDLDQLKNVMEGPTDKFETISIVGKNPFLWHDHWPVEDYAKIFECLNLVDEIEKEAARVVAKIRETGSSARNKTGILEKKITSSSAFDHPAPYMAVHMRIEKDWMIHCKKLEQRSNTNQICSSKEEITERVSNIVDLSWPVVVYVAVADSLLEDGSILSGWKDGLLPFDKKKLGVWDIYKNYSYLIQSAIDYEVCARANVFVGNSYSTFSSLIVLERTQKLIKKGVKKSCGLDVGFASYAYNILGELGAPQRWMTDMSAPSLDSISYGSNNISC